MEARLMTAQREAMELALVARLTDEATARMVQLAIEYDPHPPFGPIDWNQADRDIYEPVLGPWSNSNSPTGPNCWPS
jgi:hypothetical protein